MLIIVEGVDCSGKTTLIEQLSKKLNYKVERGSSFELTANKTQDELFNSFMQFTKLDNTILDRYIYSNEVYAPLYNDYSCLSDEQRRFIERELKGDAIIIYLYANQETIKERFKTRGEEYVDENKIEIILNSYKEALSKTDLTVLRCNTSYTCTDGIVEQFMKYINN